MQIIKKDILFVDEDLTQRLDDTAITGEAKYWINYTESGKRFLLSLHYNGSNSFLFANDVNIYKFKAKDSEAKLFIVCLRKISKYFLTDNMKILLMLKIFQISIDM